MNDWISVEEQLPDIAGQGDSHLEDDETLYEWGIDVLVWDDGLYLGCHTRIVKKDGSEKIGWLGSKAVWNAFDEGDQAPLDPTHWMPLPEPPDEASKIAAGRSLVDAGKAIKGELSR